MVNCHSNHNVSSITEETCDQDENIGDGPGKNGKDTNSPEPDVDLPVEHFPNETDNQVNATDEAFIDEDNLEKESNFDFDIFGQTSKKPFKCDECNASFFSKQVLEYHVDKKHPDWKPQKEKPLVCGDYRQSLKRKRDTPVKHSKIVRPKLKPDSCQSNIEPDFSQNRKGSIAVSDLHHEKKKSKGEKINCKKCDQLILKRNYPNHLNYCMKLKSIDLMLFKLIAKTEEGYDCLLCLFKSSSEYNVFLHIKKTHYKDNDVSFECRKCHEELLIRTFARHVEHCERYSDFMEKIGEDSYQCKLCLLKIQNLLNSRFSMYTHMKNKHWDRKNSTIKDFETNLDNHLPDAEVLQNNINAKWSQEELLLGVQGVRKFGKNFARIAEVIGTKTELHVRAFFVNYWQRHNLGNALKEYEAEPGPSGFKIYPVEEGGVSGSGEDSNGNTADQAMANAAETNGTTTD